MSERSAKHHPKHHEPKKKVRVPPAEYPKMIAGFIRLAFLNVLGRLLPAGKGKRKIIH